jgi:hypothetical protein
MLHVRALGEGERVLYVDAQVSYGALDLRVAEQDLHSAQVPGLLIGDGRLGSAQRMGPVVFRANPIPVTHSSTSRAYCRVLIWLT